MERTLIKETPSLIGKTVKIQGWVKSIRSHGKVIFIDLKDRSGILQIVFSSNETLKTAKKLRDEFVIEIEGTVGKRPEQMINKNIETGEIELIVEKVEIINKSETPPFELNKDTFNVDENLRLKYRYLDLRTDRMQKNMKLRSQFVQKAREYLFNKDFTEIETPLLTKSTPEGSRDFIVPSRLQPGEFYALPQSPQQYKQLLMTAGFERYFQIARALRDEDLRADRGFEHTQIDLEVSYVNMYELMDLVEGMITETVESLGFKIKEKPFPKISYKEAMEKHGADKFDLRTEEEKKEGILAYAWVLEFPFFEKTDEGNWTFTHNPFSMPIPEHVDWLLEGKNVEQIIATQYDLVCNGFESGGGSIRAHKPEILEATYKIMGYSPEETQESVGHMIEAFKYGTPPHGGIALGIERNLMNLSQEQFLREVVAFPMTGGGQTAIMDAPSKVTTKQLDELGLKIKGGTLYERIREQLDYYNLDFTEIHHTEVKTSEEASEVRGTPLNEGAKALVFMADDEPIQVVLQGNQRVSKDKVKEEVDAKKLKMASPEQVESVSSVPIGAVPPFGNLFPKPIKVYVDSSLLENDEIEFNAGHRGISIRMKTSEWVDLIDPIIGEFKE